MRSRTAVALAAAAASCALLHKPVSVDPQATFAAHLEHDGLAVDRLEHGRTGRLRSPRWLRLPGAPAFVLDDAEGATLAALWLSGSEATVRPTTSESAPVLARIRPSWEDGAVRFTLEPPDGEPLRTDVFARQQAGTGPPALTRTAETVIDVRGPYEATVRDARGKSVGWLRVRISPYQAAPRIYEASLPATISPPVAAAAVAALNAEIDWIEAHTLDVYRGTGGGPLEHSVPMQR
jgi:hypothetical protein